MPEIVLGQDQRSMGEVWAKFSVGHMVSTPGVVEWSRGGPPRLRGIFLRSCFVRHVTGDCGEMCEDDKAVNHDALALGARILSAYDVPESFSGDAPDPQVWIITEANRSVTTFLWPSEY